MIASDLTFDYLKELLISQPLKITLFFPLNPEKSKDIPLNPLNGARRLLAAVEFISNMRPLQNQ